MQTAHWYQNMLFLTIHCCYQAVHSCTQLKSNLLPIIHRVHSHEHVSFLPSSGWCVICASCLWHYFHFQNVRKKKILPFLSLKMCIIITGCNNIVFFKCTVVMFKFSSGLWSVALLILKVNFDLIYILLYFVTVFITSTLFKSKCYC